MLQSYRFQAIGVEMPAFLQLCIFLSALKLAVEFLLAMKNAKFSFIESVVIDTTTK